MSLTNYLTACTEKPFRCPGTYMDCATWLKDMQFLYCLEHNIRHFTHAIAAITFYSANIQIGKIIIGTTFFCRNTHFRRCSVVIYFNKETRHQLFRFIA